MSKVASISVEQATELAKRMADTGKTYREVAVEASLNPSILYSRLKKLNLPVVTGKRGRPSKKTESV